MSRIELIAVCSEILNHRQTLCVQNVEFQNVKPGGTYSNHCALKECHDYQLVYAQTTAATLEVPYWRQKMRWHKLKWRWVKWPSSHANRSTPTAWLKPLSDYLTEYSEQELSKLHPNFGQSPSHLPQQTHTYIFLNVSQDGVKLRSLLHQVICTFIRAPKFTDNTNQTYSLT